MDFQDAGYIKLAMKVVFQLFCARFAYDVWNVVAVRDALDRIILPYVKKRVGEVYDAP